MYYLEEYSSKLFFYTIHRESFTNTDTASCFISSLINIARFSILFISSALKFLLLIVIIVFFSMITLFKSSLYQLPTLLLTVIFSYSLLWILRYFATYSDLSISMSASNVEGIIIDILFSPSNNFIKLPSS